MLVMLLKGIRLNSSSTSADTIRGDDSYGRVCIARSRYDNDWEIGIKGVGRREEGVAKVQFIEPITSNIKLK